MPSLLAATLLGVLTTAVATRVLIGFAARLGWLDRAEGRAAARKLQSQPVPPVGGAAILLGLLVVEIARGALAGGAPAGPVFAGSLGRVSLDVWPALLAALALGTLDDLRRGGLSPAVKLGGQAVAGLLLARPLLFAEAGSPLEGMLWLAAAVVAQNALNTFDNADGAATSLAALGLVAAGAVASAGACLGFLFFNLRGQRAAGARAYLGDAGSHVLGILLLATPHAWPILTLPLCDLARVSVERLRRGGAPWVGDRRHLAHRLARGGLKPVGVALSLAAVAAPSALGSAIAVGGGVRGAELAGCVLSVVAFLVVVHATASTPDVETR